MKKFMTVLLVIAVMFTFSFSTAFAAEAMSVADSTVLGNAYTYAQGLVSSNYEAAIKAVAAEDIGYDLTAAEWKEVATIEAINAILATRYAAATAETTWGDSETLGQAAAVGYKALAAVVFTSTAETQITDYSTNNACISEYADGTGTAAQVVVNAVKDFIINEFGVEVALKAYEADRQEAITALDKVNYAVYSTEVDENDAEDRTYLQIAQDKVADAKEYLATAAKYTTDDWTWDVKDLANEISYFKNNTGEYYGKLAMVKGVKYFVTAELYKGYATGMYLVNGVDTITELAGQEAIDAAEKAVLKAAAAQDYASYVATPGNDKAVADKALVLINFLIDEEVITSSALCTINTWAVGPYFDENIAEIEELEAYAVKYKAEKDAEGNLVRDAKEVDKIVKAAKKAAYGNVYNEYDNSAAKSSIAALSIDSAAAELAFQKESAKTLLNKELATRIGSYYPLEAAKVQKLYDEALAKVEAAKTVTSSMTTVTIPGTILNKTNVKAAVDFSATGAPKTALNAVAAYVTYYNTGKTAADDSYIPYAAGSHAEDLAEDAIANVYGEAGARKASEYKTVTVDAAAIAAQLPTAGAIKAAKKAAEDAIDDLPATITIAHKDAVKAAWDLAKAYDKMVGGNAMVSSMAGDVSALELAIKADLVKQYALADHDDEASLDAVKALLTEYKKLEGSTNMYATGTFTVSGLTGDYAAIQETARLAVVKAINAIPVNVTAEDKAVVEAARAAYDAYVAKYTDYTDFANGFAADDVAVRELLLAEATLGLNDNSEEIAKLEAIAAIEGLKIKASSTKGKGYIKVKWTVSEEVEGVKYQVYKSTKAHSGYKKSITTSKTTFKNTKNLKKGTRYFYKVRAIGEVDGVTYYSDWSNKANRVAK